MPELPEVETAVRSLRDPLIGRTFMNAIFPRDPNRMVNRPPDEFSARIAGQTVESITRRAKYLIFNLVTNTPSADNLSMNNQSGARSPDKLVIHLKMTGHLYVLPAAEENSFDRWVRVRFPLDNGDELRFSDSRRFGRVSLVADLADILPSLGPEPLEDAFTLTLFRDLIKTRKGVLKALLLDQSFVAGVGNIYADESLHIAGLHPLRKADTLSKADVERLYNAIRQALFDGVRYEGASIGWYRKPDGSRGESQNHLRAYRSHGNRHDPCPICGGTITTIRVVQRGTHFCETCQPLNPRRGRAAKNSTDVIQA